jgi:hypothetical protein
VLRVLHSGARHRSGPRLAGVQRKGDPTDPPAVQSPAQFPEAEQQSAPVSHEGWAAASCRATLIDTRLVRAELARLRGPRPGTEIHRARMIRSSIPAAAQPRSLA